MQKRRIPLLILLVVLIVGGNIALQMWLAPPPQPKVDKVVKVLKEVDQSSPLLLLTEIPSPFRAFPAGLLLPDSKQYAEKKAEVQKLVAERQAKAAAEKKAAVIKPLEADKDVILGDHASKLLVVLSERNATVRKVTINGYQAASRRDARPEYLDVNEKVPKLFNILDDENEPSKQSYGLYVGQDPVVWKVEKSSPTEAVFIGHLTGKNITVRKRFGLDPGHYHVSLQLEFVNDADQQQTLAYSLLGPGNGPPIEGETWQARTIRQVVIGAIPKEAGTRLQLIHAILCSKGQPKLGEVETKEVRQCSFPTPVIQDRMSSSVEMQYAAIVVPFFAVAVAVRADARELQLPYIKEVRVSYDGERKPNEKDLGGRLVLESVPIKLDRSASIRHDYLLYSGPSKVRLLNWEAGVPSEIVEHYEHVLKLSAITDASDTSSWFPWFFDRIGFTGLVVFFTNLMHGILEWLHSIGAPYWLAIIFLTVLVRSAMFPISRRQALMSRNMQEKMAKLKPELAKIQEKYKEDYQARSQHQMELYRKHGVSPFGGCMGCLVVLLQMPVFLGLYWALNESVHLRLAKFLWIENLAAPDMLLHWEHWPVIGWLASIRNPFSGLELLGPYFNLLPIVSVIFMLFQQKLLAPPAMDEQQAMQMKMMNYMMILFAWLFYWVASGLCLYFTVSSAWALVERKLLPKKKTETPAAVVPPTGKRKAERAAREEESDGLFRKLGKWWRQLLEKAEKK